MYVGSVGSCGYDSVGMNKYLFPFEFDFNLSFNVSVSVRTSPSSISSDDKLDIF